MIASAGVASSGNEKQRSKPQGFLESHERVADPCTLSNSDALSDDEKITEEMKKVKECIEKIMEDGMGARDSREDLTRLMLDAAQKYKRGVDTTNPVANAGGESLWKSALADITEHHNHLTEPGEGAEFDSWAGKIAKSLHSNREFFHKRRGKDKDGNFLDGACKIHDGESKIDATRTVRIFIEGPIEYEDEDAKYCEKTCGEYSFPDWPENGNATVDSTSRWGKEGQYEAKTEALTLESQNFLLCLDHDLQKKTQECKQPEENTMCVGYSNYQTDNKNWCMMHFSKDPFVVDVHKENVIPKGSDKITSNDGKIKCMEALAIDPKFADLQKLESEYPEKFHDMERKKLKKWAEKDPEKLLELLKSMEQPGGD